MIIIDVVESGDSNVCYFLSKIDGDSGSALYSVSTMLMMECAKLSAYDSLDHEASVKIHSWLWS